MEKPLDESFMEIVTHVLTNEQHLDDTRKERARKNIEAIGSIKLNEHDTVKGDLADLSGVVVPTPSAEDHQKVLTAGNDGSFGWNALPEGIAPYDGNPAMDGTASAGSSELFARGDHVHPADTSKANKSEMAITAVQLDNSKKNIQLKNGLSQDVVVAHQDISGKANASEMAITDVSGDSSKKNIQLKYGLSQNVVVAHQNISGKEDNSNKVSAWSETTTDEHYPSEKLTKDSLDTKANKSEMAVDTNGDKTTITLKEGTSATVINAHQNIFGKADKVSGATNGNFAGLDANGDLVDSGKKAADFATGAQGTKADSAVQSVKMGSSSGTELKDGTSVVIPEATQNAPGVMSTNDKAKLDGIPEIPNTGTPGQILTKTASGNEWADAPKELPTSGSAGQFLKKTANGVEYASVSEVPPGGTTGDVLTKTENGVAWETPSSGGEPVDAYTKAETDELLGDKANKSEMSVTPGTDADDDKTTIQLKTGTSATVLTKHQDVSSMLGKSEFGGTILDTSGEPITDNTGDAIQDETMIELYDSFETTKFGAERARADASGHDIETTYATKSELNALLTSIESKLAEI